MSRTSPRSSSSPTRPSGSALLPISHWCSTFTLSEERPDLAQHLVELLWREALALDVFQRLPLDMHSV